MSAREHDDVYLRQKYKEEKLQGHRTGKDEYSGEKLFSGNQKTSKYRHSTDKTMDVDHIIPIEKVEKRYPYLTDEQIKELANPKDYSNYALTRSSVNRSKQGKNNTEYLLHELTSNDLLANDGEKLKEIAKYAPGMVSAQVKSQVKMDARAAGMYVDNQIKYVSENLNTECMKEMGKAGLDSATSAALYAGTMSIVTNTMAVIRGDESPKEAFCNTVVDTAAASGTAFVSGFIMSGINDVVPGASTIGVIATAATQIGKQVELYLDGQISGEQLQENLIRSAATMTASYIGRNAGEFLGSAIGSAIFPGVGTVAGGVIGAVVGEMITTMVCTVVLDTISDGMKAEKNAKAYDSKKLALARRAEQEIRAAQQSLKLLIEEENLKFLQEIDKGYGMLIEGITANDYHRASAGIVQIGSQFGLTENEIKAGHVERGQLFRKERRTIEIY